MADESPPDAQGSPPSWSLDDQARRRLLSELRRVPPDLEVPPTTEMSEDLGSAETLGPFRDHETDLDADPARELGEGSRVGRFLLERELGRGGFGVVYLALDESLGRRVALKTPRADRVQNAALWRRFAREARLAAALDHPAIVPALEAGVAGGVAYIASAYQEGRTLSYWIAKRKGGFPTRFAAGIAAQLASGLVHAHQRGVLHRDLKPGNVMLGGSPPQPDEPFPAASEVPARITDFGLGSFDLGDEEATQTGFWMGSPPYMAPEQALGGGRSIDTRADIYALGAVLYEMLTGRPIYSCRDLAELAVRLGRGETPPPPRQLRREIPRDLETICLKCLALDPAKRYPSSTMLLDDLRRQMEGRPIAARRAPALERVARWAWRHPSRAALIGVLVVGAAVGQTLMLRHQAALSDSNVRLEQAVKQLADSLNQLGGAKRQLQATFDELQAHDARLQREVYASALTTADSLLAAGDKESAQLTLLRQLPEEGRPDLREFAWSHLWERATRDFSVHPLDRNTGWTRMGRAPDVPPNWWTAPGVAGRDFDDLWFRVDGRGPRIEAEIHSRLLSPKGPHATWDTATNVIWFGRGAADPEALGVGGGTPLVAPDGRTVFVSRRDWPLKSVATLPPAVRERRTLRDGAEIDLVYLPTASRLTISADGRTVALWAWIPKAEGVPSPRDAVADCAPLIYELATGQGRIFPQFVWPPIIENKVWATLSLSADGSKLALGGKEPRLMVIDARDGRSLWSKAESDGFDPEGFIKYAAFSADGRLLVTCDFNGRVLLWDAETGDRIAEAPFSPHLGGAVGFYPDDETVIAFSNLEDRLRSWPLKPKPPPRIELDHGDEVWGLRFIPGSDLLASAGDDHAIRLWDLDRREAKATLQGHQTLVTALAVSPDGRLLASGDYRGHLRLWDLEAPDAPPRPLPHSFTRIRAMRWSPDGRFLAVTGDANNFLVWDRLTDRWVPIQATLGQAYGLAWSPDGSMLAAGGSVNTIGIWTWPDGALWGTIESQAHVITSLLFTSDGANLIAGSVGGNLRSWSLDQLERPRVSMERNSRPGGIWGLVISPDGRTLAGGQDDGQTFLWDPETLQQTCRINSHQDKVRALAFSPDGRKLATADFKGKILIHSGLETVGPLQIPTPSPPR